MLLEETDDSILQKGLPYASTVAAVRPLPLSCASGVASRLLAQDVRFRPASREIAEPRPGKYADNDNQREITLKHLFAETSCDDHRLSEQTVKGSKLPKLIAPESKISSRNRNFVCPNATTDAIPPAHNVGVERGAFRPILVCRPAPGAAVDRLHLDAPNCQINLKSTHRRT